MASSRAIAAGDSYTPDDINYLRADVLNTSSGHKHDGVDGAKVPFSNLDVASTAGSVAPSGGTKSYNDIATHVSSSQGAHGLNASVHVLGAASSARLIQSGTSTLVGTTKAIVFTSVGGIAFSGTPVVLITMYTAPGSGDYTEQGPWVTSISATGFTVNVRGDWSGASFGWVAIGGKAA